MIGNSLRFAFGSKEHLRLALVVVRWRIYVISRAISIKGLYAKMAKLSYIRQINRGNELLVLKESKVRLKVILSG